MKAIRRINQSMTTCAHAAVCSHLGDRLAQFSHDNEHILEDASAYILSILQTYDVDARDFAVVDSYRGTRIESVAFTHPAHGEIEFVRGYVPYGFNAQAYIHEHGSDQGELYEGERLQWMVELTGFESYAKRLAVLAYS